MLSKKEESFSSLTTLLFDSSPASNEGARRLLEAGAEKILLPELESKVLERPQGSWHPKQEHLSFWKEQLKGIEWIGKNLYLKK